MIRQPLTPICFCDFSVFVQLFTEPSFAYGDAPLLERNESLGADDEAEDDDDEDEIVFGAAPAATGGRRHSAQIVDPDAPTPVAAHRTERRFHSSSRADERTPPPPTSSAGVSYAAQAAFLSPSYQVDGQGLLDDY